MLSVYKRVRFKQRTNKQLKKRNNWLKYLEIWSFIHSHEKRAQKNGKSRIRDYVYTNNLKAKIFRFISP